MTKIDNAIGIRVTPVAAAGVAPFVERGPVEYIDWPDCGRVYYCGGSSYGAEIVEVITEESV